MEGLSHPAALAAELAPRLAERAEGYDREPAFPAEDVADLRASGLLGLMVPEALGGMGAGFEDYTRVAMELARGNASTALLFNMHASVTGALAGVSQELAAALGMGEEALAGRDELLGRAAKGEMYGVAISEAVAGSRLSRLQTGYRAEEDGFRIRGEKVACSGAGHLDGYLVAARSEEIPEAVSYFLVPSGDGARPVGGWDPLGMRATVSRGLELDLFVPRRALLGGVEGLALPLASWMPQWLVASYAAVYVGLAQAAVDEATRVLGARSAKGGGVSPAMRGRLGRAEAATAAARALLLETAREVDRAPGEDATNRLAFRAKLVAGDTAMSVASGLAEACGLAALGRGNPLERIVRDARMGAVMPPRSDVAADVLGASALGIDPALLEEPPW